MVSVESYLSVCSRSDNSPTDTPTHNDRASIRRGERDTRTSHTSVWKVCIQMFNVLVGTAVFALPSAVYTSGWLAFIVAQLLLAAASAITSFYLLQTMEVNAMKPQTTAKDYTDGDERLHAGEDGSVDRPHNAHMSSASSAGDNEAIPLLSNSGELLHAQSRIPQSTGMRTQDVGWRPPSVES
jgi:hypothetical protein